MSALGKRLQALVESVKGSWTPEEIQLAQDIATDYAALVSTDAPAAELAHVRGAGRAIVTAGGLTLADVLEEEILDFLGELISTVKAAVL